MVRGLNWDSRLIDLACSSFSSEVYDNLLQLLVTTTMASPPDKLLISFKSKSEFTSKLAPALVPDPEIVLLDTPN